MQSPLQYSGTPAGRFLSPATAILAFMAVMALAALIQLSSPLPAFADTGASAQDAASDRTGTSAAPPARSGPGPASSSPSPDLPLPEPGPPRENPGPADPEARTDPRPPGLPGSPKAEDPQNPASPDIPLPTQRPAAPGTCPEKTISTGNRLEAEFLYAGWEGDQYHLVLKLDSGETRAFVPLGMTSEFAAAEGTRIRVVWGVREFTQAMTEVCTTSPVIEHIARVPRSPRR